MNKTKKGPKLSVFMITYNHEKYISKAIESVLSQKTSFPIELVIGEDFSTDSTRKICLDYQDKYPSIIRVLNRSKNLGVQKNFIDTLINCKGEYVAYLEGDDYWTDPSKLERQVKILDQNNKLAICHHAATVYNMITKEKHLLRVQQPKKVSTGDDLSRYNYICANTVVFRNRDFTDGSFQLDSGVADWVLWMYLSLSGDIAYLPRAMSVYRIHEGGIFNKNTDIKKIQMTIVAAKNWHRLTGAKYESGYKEVVGLCYLDILKRITNGPGEYPEGLITECFEGIGALVGNNPILISQLKNIAIVDKSSAKKNIRINAVQIIKKAIRPARKIIRRLKYRA